MVTHATMDTPAITSRMLEIGVTGVAPSAEARNTLQASSPTRLCGGKARSSQAGCRSIDPLYSISTPLDPEAGGHCRA